MQDKGAHGVKNDESCDKHDELCITNDELCVDK